LLQSHCHGQFFRPLDPILFSATTVRRRSIALPSLFPQPRSRRRDLRGRPLSSPASQPRDRSASPTSDGWDGRCVPLSYKKGNPPAVLPLPSLAYFRICQYRRSCFPLRLALANPPLAHPRCCFSHSPSNLCCHLHRQPPEEVGRRRRERNPSCVADHASVRGEVRVSPLDTCSDVPLHCRRSLSSFSFPCTHPLSASSRTAMKQ
jgi:hypothetical protein